MEELKQETKETEKKPESNKFIGVILVRSLINMNQKVRDTLKMLNLHHKFCCVIVKDTPIYHGMITKCKDYLTWGEISEETIKELKEKRQKTAIIKGKKKITPFFKLHPPRGGFERKGIKATFKKKGVLGYRGSKINDLIKKML